MLFVVNLVRGVLTATGILLIVSGVCTVFAKPHVEKAFQRSLEQEMSQAFGVPVTVARARVSLLRRAARLDSVSISNPEMFRRETAFRCDQIVVKVDPLSLMTTSPRLHRVEVHGALINYRYKAGTGTNITILTDAVDRYVAEHGTNRTYTVSLLEATGATVNFSTNLVPLPNVGMRVVNVRRDNLDETDPLSDIQVARVILLSVIKEAVTLKGLTDPVVKEIQELFD